jgi:hypothetical protein
VNAFAGFGAKAPAPAQRAGRRPPLERPDYARANGINSGSFRCSSRIARGSVWLGQELFLSYGAE